MKRKLLLLLSAILAFAVALFGVGCNKKPDDAGKTDPDNPDGGGGNVEPPKPVPTLTLSAETLALDLYTSETVTATLKDSTDAIVWTSSDPTVATVEDGLITAYKVGKTDVTATAGKLTATCAVNVSEAENPPAFFDLPESLDLIKGTKETIDTTVIYKGSEMEGVAIGVETEGECVEIDENGDIVAVNYGTQTVTVTVEFGDVTVLTQDIEVTVSESGILVVDLEENAYDCFIGDEGYDLSLIKALVNGVEVENPTYTAVSSAEGVAKIENGKIVPVAKGTAVVTVSFETEKATYTTEITVNVDKHTQKVAVNFFEKGSNGDSVAETGDAAIDLTDKEIPLGDVTKVLCEGKEVSFAISENTLTLTNAPGGYNLYTLETPTVDYVIDGCVYGRIITTAEEFLKWRTEAASKMAYTVLGNDIDLGGIMLPEGNFQLTCTLDGLGHTVSDFGYTDTYGIFRYVNATGTIKNVQFVNVVQSVATTDNVVIGIFGDNVMGTIENVLVKTTVYGMSEGAEHYGALVKYLSATASIKNVVMFVEKAESVSGAIYGLASGGESGAVIDKVNVVSEGSNVLVTGLTATDSAAYKSESGMLDVVNFDSWKGWKVENGKVYMTDYTAIENKPYTGYVGEPKIGGTITFKTTSFYPLAYALNAPVTGIEISGNVVTIGGSAVEGSTFTVKATCDKIAGFEKTFDFTVEKQEITLERSFLAKGDGTATDETDPYVALGKAKIDVAELGVTGSVTKVFIDGTETEFDVEEGKIAITDAPGGDHVVKFVTAATDYIVNGCFYNFGISTKEELENRRIHWSYGYTVLLNDIDYAGDVLPYNDVWLTFVLDGRGYAVKNFTFVKAWVERLGATGAVKNVSFTGVTQDCSFAEGNAPTSGLFGSWIQGTVENFYYEVSLINIKKGHYGILANGGLDDKENSKMNRVIVNNVSTDEGVEGEHYLMMGHSGKQFQDVCFVSDKAYALFGDNTSNPKVGPETGRGTFISQRISWLITESGRYSEEILAAGYTNIVTWTGYWKNTDSTVSIRPLY